MQLAYCAHCGAHIPPDTFFCAGCGSSVETLATPFQVHLSPATTWMSEFAPHVALPTAPTRPSVANGSPAAQTCGSCGYFAPPGTAQCPRCGAFLA